MSTAEWKTAHKIQTQLLLLFLTPRKACYCQKYLLDRHITDDIRLYNFGANHKVKSQEIKDVHVYV